MKRNATIFIRRNAGFFSDFLTCLAGIKYCHDNDINFYIDWNNLCYPTINGNNLFDEFFFQEKKNENYDIFFYNLTPYGYMFTDVENESSTHNLYDFYKPFSDLLHNLKILDTPFFNKIPNYFQNKKVLGFHKRGTDHYQHGSILSDEYFSSKIDEELKKDNYDNIFMITDDLNSLNFFRNKYGNFLISTDAIKTDGNIGLHMLPLNDNRHLLAPQAILDSYLLSLTTKKIVTKSNLSTFSILCNLKFDNFIYIDKNIAYS